MAPEEENVYYLIWPFTEKVSNPHPRQYNHPLLELRILDYQS